MTNHHGHVPSPLLATGTIEEALNGYRGDNFWQDVVTTFPLDYAAIERLDPGAASDIVVLTDGRTFHARTHGRVWTYRGMLSDIER